MTRKRTRPFKLMICGSKLPVGIFPRALKLDGIHTNGLHRRAPHRGHIESRITKWIDSQEQISSWRELCTPGRCKSQHNQYEP